MNENMSEDSDIEENLTPDITEMSMETSKEVLPEKSRKKYEKCYRDFMQWRVIKKSTSFSENVMLVYFQELAKKFKSSTLWATYSMLRSTLLINHQVDISKYYIVHALLKKKAEGFKGKKSKTFSPEEINTFINEAPDILYLQIKIALIFGLMGACRRHELHALQFSDVQDLQSSLFVKISNTRTRQDRSFTITGKYYRLCKQYMNLRPDPCSNPCFFLNCVSGKCTSQNIGINKFGNLGKTIASYLHLPYPDLYTGNCFRRTSATLLVDAGGDITSLKHLSTAVAEGYIDDSIQAKIHVSRNQNKPQVNLNISEATRDDNVQVGNFKAEGSRAETSSEGNPTKVNSKRFSPTSKQQSKDQEVQPAAILDAKEYLSQICRLCMDGLNENNSALIDTAMHPNYAQKISVCCGITVDLINLPQYICYTCIDSLEQAYTFRQKCLVVNRKLLKVHMDARKNNLLVPEFEKVYTESQPENESFVEFNIVKTEILDIEDDIKTEVVDDLEGECVTEEDLNDDKRYLCELIDSFSERKKNVQEPDKSIGINKKNDNITDIFIKEFIKKEDSILEIYGYSNDDPQGDAIIENEDLQMYSCDDVNDYSSDEDELCCYTCPYAGSSTADYALHVESHTESGNSKCRDGASLFCQVNDCELEFSNFPARCAHVLECHTEESFVGYCDICPFCAFTISLSYDNALKSLDRHVTKCHTSSKRQHCSGGGFKGNSKSSTSNHKNKARL